MVVVKNKDGLLNVDALKVAQKPDKPAKVPEEKKKKKKKKTKPMSMQIDALTLNIGKVVYKDYSRGEPPSVEAYDGGIKGKTYKNITSAQKMAVLIMVEAMGQTAIKGAKIYGAAAILGVGFLPAGVVGVLIGKDSGSSEFNVDYNRAYQASVDTLRDMGAIIKEDKGGGLIKAKVDGSNVTVKFMKKAQIFL